MKKLLILLVVTFLGLQLLGCSGSKSNSNTNPSKNPNTNLNSNPNTNPTSNPTNQDPGVVNIGDVVELKDIQKVNLQQSNEIRIINKSGAISVNGASEIDNQVVMNITKIVRGKDGKDLTEFANQISVDVKNTGNYLEIVAVIPEAKPSYVGTVSVNIDLSVPKNLLKKLNVDIDNGTLQCSNLNTAIKASVLNGSIDLTNLVLVSNSDLITTNGPISADIVDLVGEGDVILKTGNGDIVTTLTNTVTANVNLSTLNGSISYNIPMNIISKESKNVLGRLNEGGTRLSMETKNGNIQLNSR